MTVGKGSLFEEDCIGSQKTHVNKLSEVDYLLLIWIGQVSNRKPDCDQQSNRFHFTSKSNGDQNISP